MKDSIKSAHVKRFFPLSLAILVAIFFSSTGVLAQESTSETKPWQFGVTIYGWFPDIAGQTSFSQDVGGGDFEVDIDQILDSLEFALMGTFDLRKGHWGILTDVVYMDAGNSETGVREASIGGIGLPAGATADVNLDLESWIWTLTGYYRALDQTGLTLDLIGGVRYLDVKQTVDWDITGNVGSIPIQDRMGTAEASLENWDAVVGMRGKFSFGAKKAWFVPLYFDLGAGDSDFTWQGIAGVGYAFRWGDLVAAWRSLYYDLPSDKAIGDISFSGPAIGVTFRW